MMNQTKRNPNEKDGISEPMIQALYYDFFDNYMSGPCKPSSVDHQVMPTNCNLRIVHNRQPL